MNRMNMANQMYAKGDEVNRKIPSRFENVAEKVSSGMRSGSTGPNVQRNIPGRMTNLADKVTGRTMPGRMSGMADRVLQNPRSTMATPKTSILPTQTLSRMGMLSRGGIGGLIAAGGLGLFELGRQTGFEPEKLGQAAAQIQKSIQEVADEAVEVAIELGQPITDYVNRVVMGYESEMNPELFMPAPPPKPVMEDEEPFMPGAERKVSNINRSMGEMSMFAKGGEASFPDLTGDGKVTQADILKGRGVFQEGGPVENEVDQALSEIQSVQPEAMVIQQVMTMVMEMIQSGASEERIVQALMEMGLDEEDIQQVMMMIAEQMQGQDPIQSELSQMM